MDKFVCDCCEKRLPKNRPLLTCSICQCIKHYKCNNLSKSEAYEIAQNRSLSRSWTCQNCYKSLFPDFYLPDNLTQKDTHTTHTDYCGACNKLCSSKHSLKSTCPWCDKICHKKCVKNTLGCISCCNDLIPGYQYDNYQINYSILTNNNIAYDLYHRDAFINLIGDSIDIENEQTNITDIADLMQRCNYKLPINIHNTQPNELRILSLNIRSLTKNISILRENIDHFKKFDILCFCETNCDVDNLPNNYNDITLDSFYKPIIQKPYRNSNKGGGLAIYVNERVCEENDIDIIDITIDPDTHNISSTTPCEHIFVKVNIRLSHNNTKKPYIVGNIYRSPSSSISAFHEYMENILTKLDRHRNKHIILAGDFNIDLAKIEHDSNSQHLIDTTTRFNFLQIINRPTRITEHSATLIDHIYTNKIHDMISSGIVTFDISDHLATYITIALHDHRGTLENDDNATSEYSKINTELLANFHELLANETWDDVNNATDTQTKYDKFIETYSTHYNSAFPKSVPRRKNERKNAKPWILPWLEDACCRKNKLYHEFITSPTIENKKKYDRMKKFTQKHINQAKNKYYSSLFNKHRDDSKKQWQMINTLLNRLKPKTNTFRLKDDTGNITSNPTDVAEQFNQYFTTIADRLKTQTATDNDPSSDYKSTLSDEVPNTLFLNPSSPSEVNDIINSLHNKVTSDSDIRALKAASTIPSFNAILCDVINSSFQNGIFPSQLKIAKVIPIHKAGSKSDVSNFRPISLLSAFSKIFEKHMHFRVYNFLQHNNCLYDMQYGFRKSRSCEHALLVAQNEIMTALNKKQIALLLLIDFSKAFDMVSHDILLHKLKHYGIRGTAHDWFKSYLEDRSQYVSINGKSSTTERLKYGVPQGSILGPLLFIIYINDIPEINKIAKFILYADDANIILTADTLDEIVLLYEELSTALVSWVSNNGLLLNIRKTNYMIFTRQRQLNLNTLVLKIGGIPIERKSVARFLGVLLDDKLTWTQHIAAIKSKMSRFIGALYRLKHILPLKARLMIFNSLVQSHLNFCSLIWGLTNKSKVELLFTTQKKAIRAIMPGFVNYFYHDGILPAHTKTFFYTSKILTVQNIILKNIYIFFNKVYNYPHLLPQSVLHTIPSNSPSPTNHIDHTSDWYEKYNSTPFNMSIFFKGPLLTHQLLTDNSEINNTNINTFKNTLKTYILKQQTKDDPIEWCTNNFGLYIIPGLRRSDRLRNSPQINHTM